MAADIEAKESLFAQLRARVAGDLRALTDSQQATQEGATHEESRPESSKDTRSIESSYLARGLAERVAKLERASAVLASFFPPPLSGDDEVESGALVEVEAEDSPDRQLYLLAPVAGGIELEWAGTPVRTVTPTSPLGQALVGRSLDDEITFQTPRGRRRATLVSIA